MGNIQPAGNPAQITSSQGSSGSNNGDFTSLAKVILAIFLSTAATAIMVSGTEVSRTIDDKGALLTKFAALLSVLFSCTVGEKISGKSGSVAGVTSSALTSGAIMLTFNALEDKWK